MVSELVWTRLAPKAQGSNMPGGVDVGKCAFPLAANQDLQDLHVGVATAGGASEPSDNWSGLFQCARRQHVSGLSWPAANAVVVTRGATSGWGRFRGWR